MIPGQNEETVGVDLDPSRRPGTPRFREPERWLNARWPIPQQQGEPSAALYGAPATPVFSTAVPLRGVSGAVRRLGYRIPDHRATHWLLLLAGDRVEVWGRRFPKVLLAALPVAAYAVLRKK